jgi:hypothetical protein
VTPCLRCRSVEEQPIGVAVTEVYAYAATLVRRPDRIDIMTDGLVNGRLCPTCTHAFFAFLDPAVEVES